MTKNSSQKKAARAHQRTHPGTPFPEAMRAVSNASRGGIDGTADLAQAAVAAGFELPLQGQVAWRRVAAHQAVPGDVFVGAGNRFGVVVAGLKVAVAGHVASPDVSDGFFRPFPDSQHS